MAARDRPRPDRRVNKLGDRWRAELVVGKERVVVLGQAGAGIPVASVLEGHLATVVGIVRRPYPTAKDRRYAVLPRGRSDLRVDGLAATGQSGRRWRGRGTWPRRRTGLGHDRRPGRVRAADRRRARRPRRRPRRPRRASTAVTVRVGGIVGDLLPDGFLLDDGTAVGPVILHGQAAELLPLVEPGDAVNVDRPCRLDGARMDRGRRRSRRRGPRRRPHRGRDAGPERRSEPRRRPRDGAQ